MTESAVRKIIHIDMDAFFASIEQRDNPAYRGKPLAVGGSQHRGVVAAASYEARKFGIHSAMPSKIAYQKCPHIIFVRPRFDVYKSVSRQLMTIFKEYTDLVEPLSLDEAYLDVTCNKKNVASATQIAKEIKTRIRNETQLTASAGISINKFLAKVASDINKPDGLTVIPPKKVEKFLLALPIEKFYGVGKVTTEKMQNLGIRIGADLLKFEEFDLIRHFGKAGTYYYHVVRGIDDRSVKPNRIPKSIGAERTFDRDFTEDEDLLKHLEEIVADVWRRLRKSDTSGKTITLKIKYGDFDLRTRARSLEHWIQTESEIFSIAWDLLHSRDLPQKPIRLLGVSISNLDNNPEPSRLNCHQLTLEF